MQRNPSYFGSYCQPSPSGSWSTGSASMGRRSSGMGVDGMAKPGRLSVDNRAAAGPVPRRPERAWGPREMRPRARCHRGWGWGSTGRSWPGCPGRRRGRLPDHAAHGAMRLGRGLLRDVEPGGLGRRDATQPRIPRPGALIPRRHQPPAVRPPKRSARKSTKARTFGCTSPPGGATACSACVSTGSSGIASSTRPARAASA